MDRHEVEAPEYAIIITDEPDPVENAEKQTIDGDGPVEPDEGNFGSFRFESGLLDISVDHRARAPSIEADTVSSFPPSEAK